MLVDTGHRGLGVTRGCMMSNRQRAIDGALRPTQEQIDRVTKRAKQAPRQSPSAQCRSLQFAASKGWRTPSFRKPQRCFAHGKAVLAGKHQVDSSAVAAHPLRGQAGRFSRTDVPLRREKNSCPRSPRLGSIVNPEAAFEASVVPGARLTPEVSSQRGVVADRRPIALTFVSENGSTSVDVPMPNKSASLARTHSVSIGRVPGVSAMRTPKRARNVFSCRH